ncbi:methionyl-tRNA synthetase [Gamsiella multidivaricata]|nr:methionyl-tRNA synthetase [Gamsiella multidivaricata]
MSSSTFLLRQWPRCARGAGTLSSPRYPTLQLLKARALICPHAALYSTQTTSPDLAEKPYYITTPIFYVNAVPHIGHLHSAVLADTFKRFQEFKGCKAMLSTGTDEHGLKIQQAAEQAGVKEIVLCDTVSQHFRALFDAANVSYTTYIRTTEPRHADAVKELWDQLWTKGYIYKGKHEGWYSVSDEAFYSPSQVEEKMNEKTGEKYHVAIETGKHVEWMMEENYKFKLSAFADRLLDWLEQNPDTILPKSRHQEVQGWLRNGLSDLSVSRPRSRLTWGIPIPGDDSHVMYVWMDALTNYLTVTGYPWSTISEAQKAVCGWPADAHVVGKDILRFHAVYWPAFLMAAELTLPKRIVAHAHWTQSKMKMSKSIGNVVDPFTAMKEFGTDAIRFYLMNDGGLADDAVPACPSMDNVNFGDKVLHSKLEQLPEMVDEAMSNYRTTHATQAIFDMLAEANAHFSHWEPWKLVKDPASKDRLDTVLWYAMESTRMAALLLQPIMPTKTSEMLDQLGIRKDERSWEFARIGRGWETGAELRRVVAGSAPMFPQLKAKKP